MDYVVLLDGQAKDKEQKKKVMGEKNVLLEVEIEQWMRLMMDADFVYTDSFHGTCFAIIYHKNFCTIKNNKRGDSRFRSLMQMTGLEEHLIEEDHISRDTLLLLEKEDINYEIVDALIRKEYQRSFEWLKMAVNRSEKLIWDAAENTRIEELEARIAELEREINYLKSKQETVVAKDTEKLTLMDKVKKKMNDLLGGEKNA